METIVYGIAIFVSCVGAYCAWQLGRNVSIDLHADDQIGEGNTR